MLTDTGGGQQLLLQLQKAECRTKDIRDVFISHRHTDHLLGLPWFLRQFQMIPAEELAERPLSIYLHPDLMAFVPAMLKGMFPEMVSRFTDAQVLRFEAVHDGEEAEILGRRITFVNLFSPTPQFGYIMKLQDGRRFLFHGDVPFNEENRSRFADTDVIMHEAFDLDEQLRLKAAGGKKRTDHSSVLQAGAYAESLGAKKLILIHGSDRELMHRKESYLTEAKKSFSGEIFAPDDFDIIEL